MVMKDMLYLSPEDAALLKLADGDTVCIESDEWNRDRHGDDQSGHQARRSGVYAVPEARGDALPFLEAGQGDRRIGKEGVD